MHQPNCSVCGRFVGRKVRVERFSPLQVTCEGCVYTEELEARRNRQALASSRFSSMNQRTIPARLPNGTPAVLF